MFLIAALLLARPEGAESPLLPVTAQTGITLVQAEIADIGLTASLSFELDGVQTTSDIASLLGDHVRTQPTRRRTRFGDPIWTGELDQLCLHRCEASLPIEVRDSSDSYAFDADLLVGVQLFSPVVIDYASPEGEAVEAAFEPLDVRRNATVRLRACGLSINARLSPAQSSSTMSPGLARRLAGRENCVSHLAWISAPDMAPHRGEYTFEAHMAGPLHHTFTQVTVDEDLPGFTGPDLLIGTRDLQAFDWRINADGAPEALRPNQPVDIPRAMLRLVMQASRDRLIVSAIPADELERADYPQPGDTILSVNGIRADDHGVYAMFAQFDPAIRAYEIEVLRKGERMTLRLSED